MTVNGDLHFGRKCKLSIEFNGTYHGQWLTLIDEPAFDLAAWFIVDSNPGETPDKEPSLSPYCEGVLGSLTADKLSR